MAVSIVRTAAQPSSPLNAPPARIGPRYAPGKSSGARPELSHHVSAASSPSDTSPAGQPTVITAISGSSMYRNATSGRPEMATTSVMPTTSPACQMAWAAISPFVASQKPSAHVVTTTTVTGK